MFNWFRRQKVQPEQEQAPPAPVEETPSEATSQEDYLDWAKKAFKNMQEKKATAEAVVSELRARLLGGGGFEFPCFGVVQNCALT